MERLRDWAGAARLSIQGTPNRWEGVVWRIPRGRGLADGGVGFPDEQELAIAGGGDGELALGGGAAEGGADVFFGVGQLG